MAEPIAPLAYTFSITMAMPSNTPTTPLERCPQPATSPVPMHPLPVVIESAPFSAFRKANLSDEDFRRFQTLLIAGEDTGTPIKGSGGLLIKTRLGVGNRGKSGGFRVIYARLRSTHTIYLLLGYAKNVSDTLTSHQIRILTKMVEEELSE